MSVVAIVLAGGAATRFGGDKLGVAVDGRPLLHHALGACAQVAPTTVLVLAPDAPAPSLPPALERRILVARDPAAHHGPLAGLAAGLEVAAAAVTDGDVAVVVGGDMPTLVPAVLELLIHRLEGRPATGAPRPDAVTLEAEPPATLPLAIRIAAAAPAARALLDADRRSLRELLAQLPSARIDAATWRLQDPEARTISDIDTPDDLAAAAHPDNVRRPRV
jgi:molybdopterin-guanine dinucleotide biosynthesis protein A